MGNPKGSSAIVFILLLFLLLALGGGGYYAYKKKQAQALPSVTSFENVPLKENVIVFVFQNIPKIYTKIYQLNNEIVLIKAELVRIDALAAEYPAETKYVQEERTLWVKIQKRLTDTVQYTQKTVESYYVAYSVNPQKGKTLIDGGIEDLNGRIDAVLKESRAETKRLKTVQVETILEKIKGLF